MYTHIYSFASVPFLDLSYLFLCVEWCSFIALVSGCVHVGDVLSWQYVGCLGNTPNLTLLSEEITSGVCCVFRK